MTTGSKDHPRVSWRQVGYNPASSRIIETTETEINFGGNVGQVPKVDPWNPATWFADFNQIRMQSWAHEGLHTEKVHAQLGPRASWESGHTLPFNQASWRLLFK